MVSGGRTGAFTVTIISRGRLKAPGNDVYGRAEP